MMLGFGLQRLCLTNDFIMGRQNKYKYMTSFEGHTLFVVYVSCQKFSRHKSVVAATSKPVSIPTHA